jgi:hypothetical protein
MNALPLPGYAQHRASGASNYWRQSERYARLCARPWVPSANDWFKVSNDRVNDPNGLENLDRAPLNLEDMRAKTWISLS